MAGSTNFSWASRPRVASCRPRAAAHDLKRFGVVGEHFLRVVPDRDGLRLVPDRHQGHRACCRWNVLRKHGQALDAAGRQLVKATFQEQLDAWLAENQAQFDDLLGRAQVKHAEWEAGPHAEWLAARAK